MNKKILIIPILIAIIGLAFTFSVPNEPVSKSETWFHVTLAEPSQYENGIFSDVFFVDKGQYSFRFVPNGDSPQTLSISLIGEDFEFYEDFRLKGDLHQTGISEYYTWDYEGQKSLQISTQQQLAISINPNGNVEGSVSVDIIEN